MHKTEIVIGSLLIVMLLVLGACTPTPISISEETIPAPEETTPAPKETGPAPEETTPAPKPPEVNFFLTLETEVAGNKLTICGETNLPDGSCLGVSVYRLYRCSGETEWYVGRVADDTATVENGKYSDVCVIDESWYEDLNRIFRNTGNPPIVEVSDELSVGVIFTPKTSQPESVYKVLGRNAEKLRGEQAKPVKGFGDTFYVLRASKAVYYTFTPK